MASLSPPKRRKLDHPDTTFTSSSLRRSPRDDKEGDVQLSVEEQEASSRNAPKLPNRRPAQAQNTDEGALYAGGMYKSSMFKLQVDEMLTEVRPYYEKRMGWVDTALHRLHSVIGAIEEREPLLVLLLIIE